MAKRKYLKVVILQTEMVPTVRKYVYVNVDTCFVAGDVVHVRQGRGKYSQGYMYPAKTCEFFVKEQQEGKMDDGTDIYPSRKKKKNKVA